MKKYVKYIMIGLLVCITSCVGGYSLGEYLENEKYNKQFEPIIEKESSLENLGEKVFEYYKKSNSTLEELTTFTNENSLDVKEVPFLENSYLNQKLIDEQKILDIDYAKLESSHKKSMDILHETISTNLKYKVKSKDETQDRVRIITYECKSFVLYQYMMDLEKLTNLLLDTHYQEEMVIWKYDEMDDVAKKEFDIYQYAAKIKAMELLNRFLSRYVKVDSLGDVKVYFQNVSQDAKGKKWRVANASEVYNNLSGINNKKYQKEDDDKRFIEILSRIFKKIGDKDVLKDL